MNRANPVELRKCREMSERLLSAGVRFVSMPAVSDVDFQGLLQQCDERLEKIISETEGGR